MDTATRIAAKLAQMRQSATLASIAAAHGLRPADTAHLSRILHGQHVAPSTLRRIGRALGVLPPARKLHRPVVSPDEWALFQQWKAERNGAPPV